MNTNPPKDAVGPDDSHGPGNITLKMIKDRAVEIAWINGRPARDLKPSDYVEAKRDLMGDTDIHPEPVASESEPESEPPDTETDATEDKRNPAAEGEDAHEEGRSEN